MKRALLLALVASLGLLAQSNNGNNNGNCPTCPPAVVVNAPTVPTSTSGVTGTATQATAGVFQLQTPANGASTFAVGQQTNTGSFAAQPVSTTGETAQGHIQLDGLTTVQGTTTGDGVHTSGSTTSGLTSNAGTVGVGQTGGNQPFTTSLLGSGSIQTGTSALLGTLSSAGNLLQGAFSSTSTNGAFNYCANGGPGWTGNGSALGTGTSLVTALPNGFTSTGSATVVTTVCPAPPAPGH